MSVAAPRRRYEDAGDVNPPRQLPKASDDLDFELSSSYVAAVEVTDSDDTDNDFDSDVLVIEDCSPPGLHPRRIEGRLGRLEELKRGSGADSVKEERDCLRRKVVELRNELNREKSKFSARSRFLYADRYPLVDVDSAPGTPTFGDQSDQLSNSCCYGVDEVNRVSIVLYVFVMIFLRSH